MGKSFYLTNKPAALYTSSQRFSDLINAAATTYGLTTTQASDYQTLNDVYSVAFLLADAPATRTKVTLLNRDSAAVPLVAKASELAKIIEGHPGVTDGQKAALGLSVRATPTPSPLPGTCSNFKVELNADGSIQTTWKANNAPGMTGVTYQVWRRFGSDGEFTYAGASGEKKYVDSTIPAGTQQVQYQVRGIRPTGAGAWAQFNVNFGMSGSGAAMASVVETPVSPKLAA